PPYGSSNGPLMDCHGATAAEGGKLFEVSRYIDYFTKPASAGGAKIDPSLVTLAAIVAPTSDVETLQANPNAQPPGPYVTCPGPVDGKTCAVALQHSCIAPQSPQFFGDPAVRIADVVSAAKNRQLTSICDTSYQPALQALGELIVSSVSSSCIGALVDPSRPDCTVEDVSVSDGTAMRLPACASNGNAAPCWSVEARTVCDGSAPAACCPAVCANDGEPGQHFALAVTRASPPPAGVVTRYSCRTRPGPIDRLPMCGAPL